MPYSNMECRLLCIQAVRMMLYMSALISLTLPQQTQSSIATCWRVGMSEGRGRLLRLIISQPGFFSSLSRSISSCGGKPPQLQRQDGSLMHQTVNVYNGLLDGLSEEGLLLLELDKIRTCTDDDECRCKCRSARDAIGWTRVFTTNRMGQRTGRQLH